MGNHCKLDLLELLALDARTLRQTLLCLLEYLALFNLVSLLVLKSPSLCYHLLA
jgi:hypothetical protein